MSKRWKETTVLSEVIAAIQDDLEVQVQVGPPGRRSWVEAAPVEILAGMPMRIQERVPVAEYTCKHCRDTWIGEPGDRGLEHLPYCSGICKRAAETRLAEAEVLTLLPVHEKFTKENSMTITAEDVFEFPCPGKRRTEEQRIESAKQYLASRPYENKVQFRGFTLEHFDESELRKIVEIAMKYVEQERRMAESDHLMHECLSGVSLRRV